MEASENLMDDAKPFRRYRRMPSFRLRDRTWPDKCIERAPRWLSTDLRDGNQALPEPMNPERKLRMFELLTRMGYKEIEVGFPAASRDDFEFVRLLIGKDLIPRDVRISVLTPARSELIDRTIESLAGAHSATVHLYNATAPFFRRVVFGVDRDACLAMATRAAARVMRAAARLDGCELGLEYSPEVFTETEPEFALEVCAAVSGLWQPGPGREIILNFPATVERTTPNVFADRIEWLSRQLPRRAHTCLSVHPHNDRGTGVAAAELAMLAGAERIEGCLFGHGERSGNVCLVTLGMNLLSHGVDPGIDFSSLDGVRRTVAECTGIPSHPRHPYAGELVYTAFSGAHQDAIKKGFDEMAQVAAASGVNESQLCWDMPYLPIDPKDVGRGYEAVIRVNSQSGKGGVGYVLKSAHGFDLPKALQTEFSTAVQAAAEDSGTEIPSERLWRLFDSEYLLSEPVAALLVRIGAQHSATSVEELTDRLLALKSRLAARGGADVAYFTDRVAAEITSLGVPAEVLQTHSQVLERSGQTVVYARCLVRFPTWGVGVARSTVDASLKAVLAAVIRAYQAHDEEGKPLVVPRARTRERDDDRDLSLCGDRS